MIGFNRRFDRHFAKFKKGFLDGAIWKREMLSIWSFDSAPQTIEYARSFGGLYRDTMPHDFDTALNNKGELPQTIGAVGTSIMEPEFGALGDVDTAADTMINAKGQIAVIKNSRRAGYGCDKRLEMLGSQGFCRP